MKTMLGEEQIKQLVEKFNSSPKKMSPSKKERIKSKIYEFLRREGPNTAKTIKNYAADAGIDWTDF